MAAFYLELIVPVKHDIQFIVKHDIQFIRAGTKSDTGSPVAGPLNLIYQSSPLKQMPDRAIR